MKKTILLSLLLALFSLSACNSPNENTSQANNLENYPELEYSFSSIYCDDVSKEARSLSNACYKIATSNTIPAKGIKSKTGARGEEIILVEDIEEMFSDMEFNSLTPEEVIIEGRISESIAFEGILNSFRCSAKMNNLVLSSMYINSQLWWISKFYLDSYDEWTIDDAVIQVKGVLEKNGDENNCQYSMSSCSVYRVISVPNKLITQEYETWSAQGYEILDKWGYPFPKEEIAICGSSNCISVYDETAELLPSFWTHILLLIRLISRLM